MNPKLFHKREHKSKNGAFAGEKKRTAAVEYGEGSKRGQCPVQLEPAYCLSGRNILAGDCFRLEKPP